MTQRRTGDRHGHLPEGFCLAQIVQPRVALVICDCTIEDSFKVTKECLGWEEVQVPDLCGIRTLVAVAWVAAGFLYQLGVTLE